MEPTITVVIVATDRKEYVKEALKSALNQNVRSADYEIILIKNYLDDVIDSELLELSNAQVPTIITSESKLLGHKVVEAVHQSKGSIICFLDDDDIWETDKLNVVLESFRKYDDIVYFHNGQSIIKSDGSAKRHLTLSAHTRFRTPANWRSIERMKDFLINKADFNGSSISILRNVILKYETVLSGINSPVDTYLFYMALESGGGILTDKRRLTRYRVGSTSLSLSGALNPREFFENRYRYHMSQVKSFEMLTKTILTDSDILGITMASIQKLNHNIMAAVYGHVVNRWEMAGYLMSWLRNSFRYHLLYEPTIFALGAIHLVSSRLSANVAYRLNSFRWG